MEDSSLAFDQAADFYDRTRALPSHVMERLVEMSAAELEGRGTCLEIGVGTGRIALPLFRRGLVMTGIDLSEPMLMKLVAKADGKPPFPLARADATRLPFRDGVFGAGLAVWVLHLIPDWRTALAELVRVIEPGGVVLVDAGGFEGLRHRIQRRFMEATGAPYRPRGTWTRGEIDAYMARLGATKRELPPIEESGTSSPGPLIDDLEAGIYSITWAVSQDVRTRAAAEVRTWAEEKWGGLHDEVADDWAIRWTAYDL